MKLKFALGLNRVSPPQELKITQDGFCECSKLQNYIVRNNKIRKVGGTVAYNSTALSTPITWCKRSYHKLGDGSFANRTLCFSNGIFYYGDDVAGTLTEAQKGFYT